MVEFGFLNEEKNYTSRYFNIKPLPDIQTRVQEIKESFYIENGWIYPPYGKGEDGLPTKPSIRYDTFTSHTLEFKPILKIVPKEFALFSIVFFGFLKGVQLLPYGHGRFYKTPFNSGKLTSFLILDDDICNIMDMAAEFYIENYNSGLSKRYYAAMFWFLYGQSYTHGFEKFDAQYRVIDSIFAICRGLFNICKFKEKKIRHPDRIPLLCEHFNIPTPVWAAKDRENSSMVSRLRNEFVHEAIFAGEPIGYSLSNENYGMHFPSLNEKLLLSIIGVQPKVFTKELPRCRYLVSLKE